MKKYLLPGVALLLLFVAALIIFWPQSDAVQERREALIRAGYTYAEAEALAAKGFELQASLKGELPVSLRVPPGTSAPTEKISQSTEGMNFCQDDPACIDKTKEFTPWASVDDIARERGDSVLLVSWHCFRKNRGYYLRGPLFSRITLEGDTWREDYLLQRKNFPDLEQSALESYLQLPLECQKR